MLPGFRGRPGQRLRRTAAEGYVGREPQAPRGQLVQTVLSVLARPLASLWECAGVVGSSPVPPLLLLRGKGRPCTYLLPRFGKNRDRQ